MKSLFVIDELSAAGKDPDELGAGDVRSKYPKFSRRYPPQKSIIIIIHDGFRLGSINLSERWIISGFFFRWIGRYLDYLNVSIVGVFSTPPCVLCCA